jgi:hypothetical protein
MTTPSYLPRYSAGWVEVGDDYNRQLRKFDTYEEVQEAHPEVLNGVAEKNADDYIRNTINT